MKKLLIAFLLLSSAAVLAAPQADGIDAAVTITPSGALANPAYACISGNEYLGNLGGYTTSYTGMESYAILIDPTACSTCDLGIRLTKVYIMLRLLAMPTYQISLAVADAVDLGGGCYAPGVTQVVRPAATMPPNCCAGGWFISIPWDTGCLDPSRAYFLIVNFPDVGTGVVGAYYDDDGATSCRAWHDDGTGWTDLSSGSMPGDIFIWAETDCCSAPVTTEIDSWGSVKTLFR